MKRQVCCSGNATSQLWFEIGTHNSFYRQIRNWWEFRRTNRSILQNDEFHFHYWASARLELGRSARGRDMERNDVLSAASISWYRLVGYLVTLDLNMNYFPILLYYSHYIFDSNWRKRRGSIFQFTYEDDIPNFVHQKSKREFIQLFGLYWAFALYSLVSNHCSATLRSYFHIFHRKKCSGVSENNSRWIIRSYICLFDHDRLYG